MPTCQRWQYGHWYALNCPLYVLCMILAACLADSKSGCDFLHLHCRSNWLLTSRVGLTCRTFNLPARYTSLSIVRVIAKLRLTRLALMRVRFTNCTCASPEQVRVLKDACFAHLFLISFIRSDNALLCGSVSSPIAALVTSLVCRVRL